MFRLTPHTKKSPAQPTLRTRIGSRAATTGRLLGMLSKKRQRVLALFVCLGTLLASMALISHAANEPTTTTPESATDRVLIETSNGDILVELNTRLAPISVENFLSYVDDGFYNGTIFHRVIDGFMIQGGGFTQAYERKTVKTPIKNEANNGLANRRYTLAMARTNAPHSATAQFFINTVDNPYLDHKDTTARGWGYAVFGKVIDGTDTVDAISTVITGPGGPFSRDAPVEPIIIKGIRRLPAEDGQGTAEEPKSE